MQGKIAKTPKNLALCHIKNKEFTQKANTDKILQKALKMYEKECKDQLTFEDFYLPFGGHLKGDNRWVKARDNVDWKLIEEKYEKALANTGMGAKAISAQVAFGALMIKTMLNLTDEETVQSISENPYMQYFLGYEGFVDEKPFDSSMMTIFRQRISAEMVDEITKEAIAKELKKNFRKKISK